MNWNRKPVQLELAAGPRTIRTRPAGEFFAACEREKRGELMVTALMVFGPDTGNGGRNGEYEFELRTTGDGL